MRAVLTDNRPCTMRAGELRRVPQDRRYRDLVGYYVCCPRCRFVTAALNGSNALSITEHDNSAVSLSEPIRCVYCAVLIRLKAGELTLEEDEQIRHVRYR